MEVPKEEPKAVRTPFNLLNLPITTKGLVIGDVWNNEGVLNIVSLNSTDRLIGLK